LPDSRLPSWIPEPARRWQRTFVAQQRFQAKWAPVRATKTRHKTQPAQLRRTRVVLQCYYRADPRAAFAWPWSCGRRSPKGYTREQGDWSLLDPVKARPSMWRRVK
jgi:hypothetical protein